MRKVDVLDNKDKLDILREISDLHKLRCSGDTSDLLHQWHLLTYLEQEALMDVASPDRESSDLLDWNEAYSWEVDTIRDIGCSVFIKSTKNVEIRGREEFWVLFSDEAKGFLYDRIRLYRGE